MSSYLWVIDLPYLSRHHHGGLLRYFNFSRELIAQGHSVTFAVRFEEEKIRSIEWLESLRAERVLTGFVELTISQAPNWNRAASLLLPFGLHGLASRPFINSRLRDLSAAAERCGADVVIVSSQSFLFVAQEFRDRPCIGDFSDSLALYRWREFVHEFRQGSTRKAIAAFRDFLHWLFREMYSSRQYAANMMVSPVDKRVFDWMGNSRKNVCIANGVRVPPPGTGAKKPLQIVFSGAMNFPPNFQGALWFLDHVFPLVLARLPEVTFVIAGAMPDPQLLARARSNIIVPGFVNDLNATLAESALYVAPLVSGSGFKNKVVEALASGTYVIGTTFAVEFLDPATRELIVVRDDPAEMATAICDFLSEPAAYAAKLHRLRQIVETAFSWPAKAGELAALADSLSKKAGL